MPAPDPLSVTAFAEAGTGVLGLAVDGRLILWHGGKQTITRAAAAGDGELARLVGPGVELNLVPAGAPSSPTPSGATECACWVEGTVGEDQDQTEIKAIGEQIVVPLGARFDSLRFVAAWIGADEALSLAAVRPPRAAGHDRDLIGAWERTGQSATLVGDPRLSITVLKDGAPLRVGLELWIEREDGETEYPRRAAGEVSGPVAEVAGATVRLEAHPIHWRAREGEGPGVLLIGRPRA